MGRWARIGDDVLSAAAVLGVAMTRGQRVRGARPAGRGWSQCESRALVVARRRTQRSEPEARGRSSPAVAPELVGARRGSEAPTADRPGRGHPRGRPPPRPTPGQHGNAKRLAKRSFSRPKRTKLEELALRPTIPAPREQRQPKRDQTRLGNGLQRRAGLLRGQSLCSGDAGAARGLARTRTQARRRAWRG
jgi:hypothetical protein